MTADITLTDAITALVSEKRAVGYKYDAEQQVLTRFEAFCRCEFPGEDTLTEASVQVWIARARRRGVTPATLQGLAAPIRELARWLGRRGVAAYLLPTAALPRPARYVPHIYTDRELAALFTQTDRCHYRCRGGIAWIVRKYQAQATDPAFANARLSPHVLRHSRAMHLYDGGVPLPYIRDILGHVDLSTTEIYARASTEAKRKALEAAYADVVTADLAEWNQNPELLSWLASL